MKDLCTLTSRERKSLLQQFKIDSHKAINAQLIKNFLSAEPPVYKIKNILHLANIAIEGEGDDLPHIPESRCCVSWESGELAYKCKNCQFDSTWSVFSSFSFFSLSSSFLYSFIFIVVGLFFKDCFYYSSSFYYYY